jgi:hypothetical protein
MMKHLLPFSIIFSFSSLFREEKRIKNKSKRKEELVKGYREGKKT